MSKIKILDSTLHDITAAQALQMILRTWNESRDTSILFIAKAGDGKAFVQRIRTELSQLRAEAQERGRPFSNFGIKAEPIPVTVHIPRIHKEGILLNYHMSSLQAMKNFANRVEVSIND